MGDELLSVKNILTMVYFGVLTGLGVMSIIASVIKLFDPSSPLF